MFGQNRGTAPLKNEFVMEWTCVCTVQAISNLCPILFHSNIHVKPGITFACCLKDEVDSLLFQSSTLYWNRNQLKSMID
jgi:hypothetical protein